MTDTKLVRLILRLIVSLSFFVVFSYVADWALRAENFPVESVRFEGPFEHVTQPELELATLDTIRGNFFLIDLGAVQRRVEALPWVQRASVQRRFPHDITIRFSEQQLAAHWGENDWLNASGEVLHVATDDTTKDLPRLDGPTGTSVQVYRAYRQFRERLSLLDARLVGVSLSARRSWRLELQPPDGQRVFTLVVDHEQPLPRLERFIRVYAAAFGQREAGIKQVDLRYTNGFAVQWYPDRARVAHAAASRNEG